MLHTVSSLFKSKLCADEHGEASMLSARVTWQLLKQHAESEKPAEVSLSFLVKVVIVALISPPFFGLFIFQFVLQMEKKRRGKGIHFLTYLGVDCRVVIGTKRKRYLLSVPTY